MAISAVGTIALAHTSLTIAVDPTNVGDILVLTFGTPTSFNSSNTLTGVSGGGVTTWTISVNSSANNNTAIAWGIVTTVGSTTITVTTNAAPPSVALGCLQFTGGGPGTWTADGTNTTSGSSSSSGNYASVTPSHNNDLYWGVFIMSSTVATIGGSTAGFTYLNPMGSTSPETGIGISYNTSASVPTAQSPAWSVAPGQSWASVAICLTFTSPSSNLLSFC